MSWQKYFDVVQIQFDLWMSYLRNHLRWVIVYNTNCAESGKVAYQVYYRTKRHAVRGADRLYKRTLGEMEHLLELQK